jgi:hypothetical protein
MTPEDLVEIELIKRLKHRYVRCVDQKAFEELETCFVPEATASYGGGAIELDGRDAIMDFLRQSLSSEQMLTSHRVHEPEIDLDGDDTAVGGWALEDRIVFTDQPMMLRGESFYTDRYVKRDGEWRILHTGYKRMFEELVPKQDGTQITADWFASEGRSSLL